MTRITQPAFTLRYEHTLTGGTIRHLGLIRISNEHRAFWRQHLGFTPGYGMTHALCQVEPQTGRIIAIVNSFTYAQMEGFVARVISASNCVVL